MYITAMISLLSYLEYWSSRLLLTLLFIGRKHWDVILLHINGMRNEGQSSRQNLMLIMQNYMDFPVMNFATFLTPKKFMERISQVRLSEF